jgi:hydrogenase-4 component F
MGPLALVLLPLSFALVALLLPGNRWRPLLLPVGGTCHLLHVLAHSATAGGSALGGWLVLDPLARLLNLTVALVFFFCALYAPAYLRIRPDRPNRFFCGGLLLLVAMLTLVAMAHHLGLMWVALEATTLTTAPLLYFNQTPRSLEAAWKFLLVGSVGIALALFGSFLLGYAALKGGQPPTLLFDDLIASAPSLSKPWLHAAFVTLLVGYGTKMGLAPLHMWKPDAYGEAPGVLGALLAGGVTGGAFLAVVRFLTIINAAGEHDFARPILIGIGLLSMAFAAVFMTRQRDFKRLLAYSSVEHMGILVLGAGIGGLALYGALLHLLNNALAKCVLFLSSGNIHRAFGSKSLDQVAGAASRVPLSAGLFLFGFLAITGTPPLGPFVSEFTIVRSMFAGGDALVASLFLLLMLAVFLGMGSTVLAVVQGRPPAGAETRRADTLPLVLPIALAFGLVLFLGVHVPAPLAELVREAAAYVEAGR